MMPNDWVNFDHSATSEFSENFKKQLSEQLKERLRASFGTTIPDAEFNFIVMVGAPTYQVDEKGNLATTPFRVTANEQYAFANAQLVSVFAQSYNVTIAWSSPDFKNPLEIHASSSEHNQLNFYWCDDLPKDEIVADLAPVKIKLKSESRFTFDVRYHLKVYPDVTIFFEFENKPAKKVLDAVHAEVIKFRDTFKTAFVHNMFEYNGGYAISINHNGVDYSAGENNSLEQVIDSFDFILNNINCNPEISGLTHVTFL